jgi:hypothetical protein
MTTGTVIAMLKPKTAPKRRPKASAQMQESGRQESGRQLS